MSLELLNTIGTLLTASIITATAITAIVQLRHLRAGNQIAAMLQIGQEFADPKFERAQELVRTQLEPAIEDPLFRAFNDAFDRGLQPPDVPPAYLELRRAANTIGNAYEELGILVKNGIVDRALFLDRYSWVLLNTWKRLALVTAWSREATGMQAVWENFEYVAVLSEDWIRDHPIAYPRGVRRMELPKTTREGSPQSFV